MGHNFRKKSHRELRKAAEEIGASLMSCSGWDNVSSHARVRLDQRLPEGEVAPNRRAIKVLASKNKSQGKKTLKFGDAKVIVGGRKTKIVTYIA